MAAKFSAEFADGVGPDSAIYVFNARVRNKAKKLTLRKDVIDEYKQKWKDLPRVPKEFRKTLRSAMERVSS